MVDTALLVIDVQCGFIENEPRIFRAHEVLEKVKLLIHRAGRAQAPIIYIQHNSDPEIDGPIHPAIAPQEHDYVVAKYTQDAFFETALEDILHANGIETLVIAGFQTEFCIDTTCKRANDLGYKVILAEDAHSTYGDAQYTAPAVIAAHAAVWQEFACVAPTHQIRFN